MTNVSAIDRLRRVLLAVEWADIPEPLFIDTALDHVLQALDDLQRQIDELKEERR